MAASAPSLPPAQDRPGPLRGLKAHMAFILGVVLVPALLYSCWQAIEAYSERQAQRAAMVAGTLKVIASYEAEFFDRTRTLLLQLAAEPAVRDAAQPACSERLIEARNRTWDYLNFVVLGQDGMALCSSAPDLMGPMGDRAYFRQLRDGLGFVVSGILERRLGDGQTIVAAVPVLAPGSGAFSGAIAVAVNLQSFQRAIDSIDLPNGGVAYLTDASGRLLVNPAARDARSLSPAPSAEQLAQLIEEPDEAVTVRGEDGVARDFYIVHVAAGELFAVAGIPTQPHFAWVQRDLLIGVFAPTLMLALAMITIWIASDYLVIRHVRTLGVAARAYSRGELDLRLDFASAPAEFQELAHTLARMAGQVRRREEELRASLAQKDLLLREVHHRVKNNLQIVTSLLNLRAQRLHTAQARDAVRQAQMRIAAMTLVHRRLYETDDIREIELASFLEDLCGMLEETNDAARSTVELTVQAEPVCVPPDHAIPLALLITEAVSNAFKHAFPAGGDGRIEVRLEHEGEQVRLVVADNGAGLGAGEEVAGMGVTLMRMLAKQVGGSLSMTEASGTRLELIYPVPAAHAAARPAAAAA